MTEKQKKLAITYGLCVIGIFLLYYLFMRPAQTNTGGGSTDKKGGDSKPQDNGKASKVIQNPVGYQRPIGTRVPGTENNADPRKRGI